MAKFKYSPLPNNNEYIRLVDIHSGTWKDDIHLSLDVQRFSTGNDPQYEALSYVWGSEDNPKTVQIKEKRRETAPLLGQSLNSTLDDHQPESKSPQDEYAEECELLVTQNLETALRHLRLQDKPRVMWIDAICIDQSSDQEKSTQVAFMGQLYEQASRVVAWLGPEENNSARALLLMQGIGSQVLFDYDTNVLKPAPGAPNQSIGDAAAVIELNHLDWTAVYHLLSRPWFERLWVRQEIHLAKPSSVVQCGQNFLGWDTLRRAIVCCFLKSRYASDVQLWKKISDRLGSMSGMIFQSRSVSFGNLRMDFSHAKCGDPRDRVYAILGMLTPNDKCIGISPDYTKTTVEVFRDAFLSYLNHYQIHTLLPHCQMGSSSLGISWVPDWSTDSSIPVCYDGSASSSLCAWYEHVPPDILKVAGVFVDSVAYLHQPNIDLSTATGSDILGFFGKMLPSKTDVEELGVELTTELYARTWSLDEVEENYEPPYPAHPSLAYLRDCIAGLLAARDSGADSIDALEFRLFIRKTESVFSGRKFFRTAKGQIGMGLESARVGDRVAVLMGCNTPMLLRQDVNGHHLVVGECFSHGVNNGEALLGPIPSDISPRRVNSGASGRWVNGFKNIETGKILFKDPRLNPVKVDTDENAKRLENNPGTIVRLDPKVIQETGVNIEWIELV